MLKQIIILFVFPFFCCAQSIDSTILQAFEPRNVGPAGFSGRVTAIDAVHNQPDIIYVGTASGGLWKSEGGGVVWTPIFDNQTVSSIGAIAINQQNPNEIWVGTGEGNPRNSQTLGGGIFRSINGGKSWELMGLEKTKSIHRIIINPLNSNEILVAALGNSWADSADRGIYKSKDGGKTWNKVLYLNNRTGGNDLIVDPNNPNKLFANMWEYRRWPWFFKSGGSGSGLYMSEDGGDHWTKLTDKNGLPKGELGKIGLGIGTTNSDVVYALVENKKNALYKSVDGGKNWKKIADKNIGDRPFYYGDIHIDPSNENRIYNVFSNVTVSEDGGKTFKTLLGWDSVHGDHHAWWIHPTNPDFMIDGNDGGIAITRDKGKTWRFVENLPVSQFYHVKVDDDLPYNIYGGTQDNGTWRGPAYIWQKGGIRNGYWDEIAFGDGFDVAVLPDFQTGFAMSQGGHLRLLDFNSGASELIKPVHPEGEFLRFNWNAALAQDPFDPHTIYYGSQYVHKSSDYGKNWEIISPDLTTNDTMKHHQSESGGLTYDATGAENFTTIISLDVSPMSNDIIWAGTDDGHIQVTRDGGKNWSNTTANPRAFPKGAWVAQVTASEHNQSEAFAIVNDYRRGNSTPYLLHTTDFGRTWKNLAHNKGIDNYTLSFIQDPVLPDLLFLGTESGLYMSTNKGNNWTKWTQGLPNNLSTYDMDFQKRENDLVIGSFGRSFWVIDNIEPLRNWLQSKSNAGNIKAYPTPTAYLSAYKQAAGTRFHGDAIFRGENRPYGAMLTYYINNVAADDAEKDETQDSLYNKIKVSIVNSQGDTIRQFTEKPKKGMNRIYWRLNRDGLGGLKAKEQDKFNYPEGNNIFPGKYTAVLQYRDAQTQTSIEVKQDPKNTLKESPEALAALDEDIQSYFELYKGLQTDIRRLENSKKDLKTVMAVAKEMDSKDKKTVLKEAEKTKMKIDSLLQIVFPPEEAQGIIRNPDLLSSKIGNLHNYLKNPNSAPFGRFSSPNPIFRSFGGNLEPVLKEAQNGIRGFSMLVDQFYKDDWKSFKDASKNVSLFHE